MTIRQEISSTFKCPILAPTEDNLEKLGLDPNQKTDIENRFHNLQQLMRLGTTGAPTSTALPQAAISHINTQNMVRVAEAVRSNTLKPSAVNGFNRMLARDFGITNQWFGLGDEYTEQGWVRESISRIQRLWKGGMRETLQRMAVNETFKQAYEPIVARMRALGLRTDQIDRITTNAVELGFAPFIQNAESLAPRGRQVLLGKYDEYIAEMRALGLPKQLIDEVLNAGNKVAQTNHRILSAMQDAGINVPETPFFGYFPRIMSEEASMRFNWKWRDENHVTWNNGSDSAITESFLKGRTTSEFIVEDEVIMDFLLRNLGRLDHDDPLYYYRAVNDSPDAGIADVLDSRYGLAQVVKQMLEDNHSDVVKAMIDSALISKVPFTNVETFEHIRDTLNFPFDNLREVFAADWRTGMQVYQTQLETIAAQTGFVNLMVKEVTQGGWGVTALQRASNPDFANWVPLRDVLEPRILGKTFQADNPMLNDYFVHPVAAELAVAAQKLQMSPMHMGSLARAFASINRTFRQLALATIEYVPRQFWQVAVSTAAAGGSIATLPIYMSKMIMYELSQHFNIGNPSRLFNNTKPTVKLADGRVVTEWEAFQWGLSTGILTRFDPVQGQISPGRYRNGSVVGQLRYLSHTLKEEGIPRTLEEFSTLLSSAADAAYYPLAVVNNIMNNAAAFNTLMTVTKRQSAFDEAVRIGSGLTSLSVKSFETLDEAFEHTRRYFFLYDDFTYMDTQIRNFVIPFWGYLGKAIPAAVRYAIRHPSRFYAHQQLYALANSPVQDDEWLSEGTVDEWTLHANPIFFRVPGLRDDGRDSYFVVPLESIDPVNSAISWLSDPAQSVLEYFGIWNEHIVRTTSERLDNSKTNTMINRMLEETFPVWKGIASEVRGEDLLGRPLEEGGKVNEYLGLRMSPRAAMWIETLLPVVGSVNRINPGGVFGTPSRYDPFAQEWTLGEPSWAGVPRSSRDAFLTNNPYQALRYAGIKVYPVDVYLNAGHTYDSLSISLNEMDSLINKMKADLPRLDGNLRREREVEIAELEYLYEQTVNDMKLFADFMKREGLNPRAAYDTLRQQNIRIGDLDDEQDTP